MKTYLKGAYSEYSGYGNDMIGMTLALMEMGADNYMQPTVVQPPLPRQITDLLTKRLDAIPPFDLFINHVDPSQLNCTNTERVISDFTLGWTMWEYSSIDNMEKWKKVRKACRNFDVIACYDSVSAGAMAEATDKPIIVQQGGYIPEDWAFVERQWEGPFRFFMCGALGIRKDPFLAVEAFKQLKEEKGADFADAELHLKDNGGFLHPDMEKVIPKCRVHFETLTPQLLHKFMAGCHVLLAPSHGEGKNLPALQFMTTGGTVIATNWSGHTAWMNEAYAYPLDYRLQPVSNKGRALWAQADIEHLKHLMWHCYTHRDEVARKGELAAQIIPQMCSWRSVLERLFLQLEEVGDAGAKCRASALSCKPQAPVREVPDTWATADNR